MEIGCLPVSGMTLNSGTILTIVRSSRNDPTNSSAPPRSIIGAEIFPISITKLTERISMEK
uniref:Uncharacterized protein n=1 Tax=Parascaris equorum TaxID=6256 RepID=A0A914RDJ1_PAREQ